MGLQLRWQTILVPAICALGVLAAPSGAANAAGVSANPGPVIVVAGDGASLTVSGTGYTGCASQDVSVFLVFPQRKAQPPPAGSPYRFLIETPLEAQRFSEVTVHVDGAGDFSATLPMPAITPSRWHGYAVMAAGCAPAGYQVLREVFYAAPATAATLVGLETGIPALPPGASAVVIPSLVIDSVPGANDDVSGNYLLDHLTTYANGERCATLNLKPASARDAAGDAVLVIGTDDEPAACRQRGSELTFSLGAQDYLVAFRTTVLPGVVQPIALTPFPTDVPMTRDNMLPAATVIDSAGQTQPPPDAPPSAAMGPGQGPLSATPGADSPTPAAPVDGTGVAATSTTRWLMVAGTILLAISVAAFGLKWKGRTQ